MEEEVKVVEAEAVEEVAPVEEEAAEEVAAEEEATEKVELAQFILNQISMERKLTEEEIRAFEGALTLPEDMAEATDFEATEAIKVDYSVKLPEFFSL